MVITYQSCAVMRQMPMSSPQGTEEGTKIFPIGVQMIIFDNNYYNILNMEAHIDYQARIAAARDKLKKQGGKSLQAVDGVWDIGPEGTYIFSYIIDKFPKSIVDKIVDKVEEAIKITVKLGQIIVAGGGEVRGSNFLCKETEMRKALLLLGFGLTSTTNEDSTYQGNAQQMTLNYFQSILSTLSGDVSLITNYLMEGMTGFQELTKYEPEVPPKPQQPEPQPQPQPKPQPVEVPKDDRSCSQVVILITAKMMTSTKGIVTMGLRYIISSNVTDKEVSKVRCEDTQKTKVKAIFKSEIYAHSGKPASVFDIDQ